MKEKPGERSASNRVDELLDKPYWVVDLLPEQVPPPGAERFFAAEEWLLGGDRGADLRRRFVDVLLKLSCYYDFEVFRNDDDQGVRNPPPQQLADWILQNQGMVNVVVDQPAAPNAPEPSAACITVPDDTTCMTVYNPSARLLGLIDRLAVADGLFVWRPGQASV